MSCMKFTEVFELSNVIVFRYDSDHKLISKNLAFVIYVVSEMIIKIG